MNKRTPLFEIHKQMGARIIAFSGWDMPVQYTTIIDEHLNTRTNASLFDISHMGVFEASGRDSFNLIQQLITNDISRSDVGEALYTPICYENGTIVDDIIIYMISPDHFLLVVNASNRDKDLSWINQIAKAFDIELKDISNDTALLALQGPKAEKILQKITTTDLGKIKHFGLVYDYLYNTKVLISRTGYTGEDGFELFFAPKEAERLWTGLLEIGKEDGIMPAGLGARDTLRLEACLRLYGMDIDDTTTPLEAGLAWSVRFDKPDFIGKEALLKQLGNIKRRLIAFEMTDRAIARHGYPVYKDEKISGYVTSGTFSPGLNKSIGMAYVDLEYTKIGEEIEIMIRNKPFKAKIVQMPFIKRQRI